MPPVYAGENRGASLVALNASDGTLRWRIRPTGNDVVALSAGQGLVQVTPGLSSCGSVTALKASNGQEAWSFQTRCGLTGLPAVIDGIVNVSEADQSDGSAFLDALNASDGSQCWRVRESQQAGIGGL